MTHLLNLGAFKKLTSEYVYPKIANEKDLHICPECNKELILCQGEIIRPYFRHKVDSVNPCHYYINPSEAQIHKDAKRLLKKILEKKIQISFIRTCFCCKKNEEFEIPEISETSEIKIEHNFQYNGKKIADVAYIEDDELLSIFEIYNTHKTHSKGRPEPWFEMSAEKLINLVNNNNDNTLTSLQIPCIRCEKCDNCIENEKKILEEEKQNREQQEQEQQNREQQEKQNRKQEEEEKQTREQQLQIIEKGENTEFRLIDFNVSNITDYFMEEENNDIEQSSDYKTDDSNFIIQMFGINEKRETASINITGFKPFFYLKVDNDWNEFKKKTFYNHIKKKVGKYYANSFYEFRLIQKKKLYGFDGGIYHTFIYVSFNNITCFYKVKNMWYTKCPKGENVLNENGYLFNETNIFLYEANIPPLLRFFHIQKISPSGWILLPNNKTKIIKDKKTTCFYELSIDCNDIISLNNKETRVPYKICSFDIEASSSHGDFPIPKKTYKKLAQNVVDYFIEKDYSVNNKEKRQEYIGALKKLILSSFGFCEKLDAIDLVYPKNKNITQIELEKTIDFILNTQLEEQTKTNSKIVTIEDLFEKMNKNDEEEDIAHTIFTNSSHFNKLNVKINTIIDLLIYSSYEREFKIIELNKVLTNFLPPLEGDKVTFIGSTFMMYGESSPYLSNCIALNTCDTHKDIEIETYNSEKEVLLAWTNLIQKEDPDIIIGYNIFGFDYTFMFYRAKECDCIEEFLKLSRNKDEICGTFKNGCYNLEETKIAIASGTHELAYIKMNGRIQIDLYNYFRREENLTSYKLDYVAGYFIGDYVKKIEHINENETKIYTMNFIGLVEESFIHFEEIDFSTEYYNNGEKFKIHKIIKNEGYFIVQKNINFNFSKKIRWCLAKDDVTPKDIFRMSNGTSSERFLIAKYCIQDCNLIHYLLNKIDVITGLVEMSNICSVPIEFIIYRGQGIKLTSYVAKKCREKGVLMPVIKKGSQLDAFEGAIVLEPKCDLYLDLPIPVGDFSSLYPSSMISENLSHDSKVWTKQYDLANNLLQEMGEKDECGNFIYDNLKNYEYVNIKYDTYKYIRKTQTSKAEKVISGYKICRFVQPHNNEKGVMPSILVELLAARKATKKLIPLQKSDFMKNVYDKRQLAYKITANSLYGQCGAKTSTFYEQDIAASTTATGRKLLNFAKSVVEECYGDTICNNNKYGLIKSKASHIYGDTDSVFFAFNLETLEGEKIKGQKALEISIELAQEAMQVVSKFLKQPHDFVYEKTFMPFCLLSKKKYVGMLYETDPTKCKRKEMGIVLKRRDNAPIVKDIYGGIIDILMKEQNIEKAIKFLDEHLKNIIEEKCPIEKLIISKSLNSFYKKPKQIAHKVLADRITSRDPGNRPSVGDRIPFVYVHTKNKNVLQGEKIETPFFIKENNLKIDYSFYISNQVMKPLQQLFSLILEKIWEMQKKISKIKNFKKEIENLKNNFEMDKFYEKLEKLKNEEVKKLLFDKYLIQSDNNKNCNQSINKFFKTKK
jgi:DNA polymerase elongation subunit (family B)